MKSGDGGFSDELCLIVIDFDRGQRVSWYLARASFRLGSGHALGNSKVFVADVHRDSAAVIFKTE